MKKRFVAAAILVLGAVLLAKCRLRRRPDVAVLLGAGFSQAAGIPGTHELTQLLDEHYADRRRKTPGDHDALVFERLASELRTEFGDSYNFEVLLDAAEASRQFLAGIPYVRPQPHSSLRPVMQIQAWLGANGLDVLNAIMETGYTLIRNVLVEAERKVTPEAKERIRGFFDRLAERYQVSCINLNYDETLDAAVPGLYTGFDVRVENSEGKGFNADAFLSDNTRDRMVHLHGSVAYRFPEMAGSELLRVPDAESAGRQRGWVPTDNGSIYGGMISGFAKSEKLLRPPYNSFYHWAADALIKAPRVVVYGYGVGDLHLNVWLAQAAIAHGDAYRLCFITRSDDLDKENLRLQGLLSIAAGYRYTAQLSSLEGLLEFDDLGFAAHKSLAVLRSGFPKDSTQFQQIMKKLMRFLRG